MPEKVVRKEVYWKCKVCDWLSRTRKEALAHERKKPEKAVFGDIRDAWKVGDFLLIRPHDCRWNLGKIVGTKVLHHTIFPVMEFYDGRTEDTTPNFNGEECIIVTDTMKRTILKWADEFAHDGLVQSTEPRIDIVVKNR